VCGRCLCRGVADVREQHGPARAAGASADHQRHARLDRRGRRRLRTQQHRHRYDCQFAFVIVTTIASTIIIIIIIIITANTDRVHVQHMHEERHAVRRSADKGPYLSRT
jgi:uncharacterized integral membrane protein